jgi:hypothetical protein
MVEGFLLEVQLSILKTLRGGNPNLACLPAGKVVRCIMSRSRWNGHSSEWPFAFAKRGPWRIEIGPFVHGC